MKSTKAASYAIVDVVATSAGLYVCWVCIARAGGWSWSFSQKKNRLEMSRAKAKKLIREVRSEYPNDYVALVRVAAKKG